MERLFIRCAGAGLQIGLSLWLALPGQAAERRVLHGSVPAAAVRLQLIGPLPDSTRLNLAISLPLRNQPALAGLLQQIYDPASPNFHRFLTPAQFAEQFGPAREDYQALMDFAEANHFKVTHTHPNRTLLDVSASVADIRRVLRVRINVYQHPTEGRTFYAPDADPSLDAGIAVLAIKGLDDFILPHSNLKPAPQARPGKPEPLAGSADGYYFGNDFRAAYAPGVLLDGTGQTAALVEFAGYYPADIAAYENTADPPLPAVPLTDVVVNGDAGELGLDDLEAPLDIEMLIAMAPGLNGIMVYETVFYQSADDLFNQIATDNLASQISCSWSYTPDATADQIFQQYAAQGQSLFIASGDSGADAAGFGDALVDDPYATIVGGTQLSTSGDSGGGPWQSETVWDGSGGGISAYYPIPVWQAGMDMSGNQGSATSRNFPDVAICASNIFITYGDGGQGGVMGTSCGAPLWAGFTALVNQQAGLSGNGRVGFLNPALYAMGRGPGYGTNFHDITVGNTTNANNPGGYFAVPGYDLCTGWGTPNGSNMINTLAPPDTLVMLPIPGFASSGLAGGPFSGTTNFLLTNSGPVPLDWTNGVDSNWLSVSPSGGTLNPGGTANVVVSLNSAASSLPCGDYAGHLTVTNLSNGLLHQRTFTLTVLDPLTASPAAGLEFAGPPSGPFNLAAETCWITNASQASVSWSLLNNPLWLNIAPSGGILASHSAVALTCSLNSTATNLPNLLSGAYSGSIAFTNITFGAVETLPALLLDGQLVQNGGFETGNFQDWTLTGSSFAAVSKYVGVHSGTYGAALSTSGAPGYLSQTVPTSAGQMYSVSVWLNNPDGVTPNGFSLSWGGSTLCQYANLPVMGWTNLQFVVPAAGSATVLQIEFQDDSGYLGLDDISVTPAPPTIAGVSPAIGPTSGGTPVTITGAGFQSLATVAFGSAPAASVQFNSTSSITAVTPASAIGLVNVTITNADGQTAVLANGFQFMAPPVPANIVLQRSPACGAKVRWTNLLAGSADPNGLPLTFVSASPTSTNGGTVAVSGNWIFYTPQPGFTNSDAFSYVIADSAGLQAAGTVTITVPGDLAQSQNIVAVEYPDSGGSLIQFQGIPAYTYRIQFSESLQTPDWLTLGTNTADATGAFEFTDANGSPARSYRSINP